MRGSGVVQSLKSLASKLHPQLPLSPKESQRLLTALTSSFRKQLDEAHPRQIQDEDASPKRDSVQSGRSGAHALHTSSAALADRHLASVLTNPLLAKDASPNQEALNYEKVKQELEQNPDKDPILVLEEYHDKGEATLPIANLCLRTFMASLEGLPDEDRQQRRANVEAGKRTLLWLWRSKLHETDEFVDNRALMGALVTMLVEEGEEHFLWSWLKLDLQYGTLPETVHPRSAYEELNYRFRWKAFMLRKLALASLNEDDAIDKLFDVYFKAVDVHLELKKNSTTNMLPLAGLSNTINSRLFNNRHLLRMRHVTPFNRYMETMPLTEHLPHWVDWKKALLHLIHPQNPTALPVYRSLYASFQEPLRSFRGGIWYAFVKNRDHQTSGAKARDKLYVLLLETARQLKRDGQTEEMDWIVERLHSAFPEKNKFLAGNLEQRSVPLPKPSQRPLLLGPQIRFRVPSTSAAGAT